MLDIYERFEFVFIDNDGMEMTYSIFSLFVLKQLTHRSDPPVNVFVTRIS